MDAHDALRSDPTLGPLIERFGELTINPASDLFERLVISILRQQVSMASAAATRERLFERVTVTPAGIIAADVDTLRDAGLSRQKVRYIKDAANTFQANGWSKATFAEASDDAVRTQLTEITGVGPWTANMQLLFALGRPDVFPVGDLGVRQGMAQLFDLDRSDRESMRAKAERWAPYRSYATLYLWRVDEDIAAAVTEVEPR